MEQILNKLSEIELTAQHVGSRGRGDSLTESGAVLAVEVAAPVLLYISWDNLNCNKMS